VRLSMIDGSREFDDGYGEVVPGRAANLGFVAR
jgi:hypothetical protein